jgi:putative membrane-bound dehydrogenase-like protein
MRPLLFVMLFHSLASPIVAEAPRKPKVEEPGYELELVLSEPKIATPVSLAVDKKGRVWFIESHTHFRPQNYAGPPADRIQVLEMAADGSTKLTTFHQGFKYAMSLALRDDGSVFVATRNKIVRLRDKDGDGVANKETILAKLETKGDYPHNGLCGLAFDNDGTLIFGMGENLGEPYKLIGADGTTIPGGGEGGNIYRIQADGSKLKKFATGVWNPFGICVDPHGRIFCVENDPDARPPCRLLQIVGGGDYGFQFRYGRAGTHPLQAWDGELPGTLPMIAGTGEAPCTVLIHRGELWATSWGDNRIEKFDLKPHGASFKANRTTVVQGDEKFRPTGMAVAPNGDVWFCDWVDRSYTLHNQGRLWRLRPTAKLPAAKPWPEPNETEKAARWAEIKPEVTNFDSPDPFTHQAAVWGFAQQTNLRSIDFKLLKTGRQRAGFLQSQRWNGVDADRLLPLAIDDMDPEVRFLAVRWIADERLTKYRDAVLAQASRPDTPFPLAKAAIAATAWLDAPTRDFNELRKREHQLYADLLADEKKPATLRNYALRSLPVDHPAVKIDRLTSLVKDRDLGRTALWSAIVSNRPERVQLLSGLASDASLPAPWRADALAGLPLDSEKDRERIKAFADDKEEVVRKEANRLLRHLVRKEVEPPAKADEIDAWEKLVAQAPGDAESGKRVFFGRYGPACMRCHAIEGRGGAVGPDLSQIHKQPMRRLLESILQPSREIAPQYQTVVVETTDGRTLTGVSLGKIDNDRKERFLDAEGKEFVVETRLIENRQPSPRSIMVEGLEKTMTVQELRDLLAFLRQPR